MSIGRQLVGARKVTVAVVAAVATVTGGVVAASPATAAATVTRTVDDAVVKGAERFTYGGPWKVCQRCRKDTTGPSFQDVRGTWGYATMGGNVFSTQTGPNSAVADRVWGCRSMPSEGMPCTSSSDYPNLFAAARGYHPGGVNVSMADGSVRFVSDNINLTVWQAMGSRAAGEVIGN